MKVIIGTQNPGKIEGARRALTQFFDDVEIVGVKVPSQVADQPVNRDTFLGADNRVKNLVEYAKQNNLKADLFMAVESGITNELGSWLITNIAVVADACGHKSVGTSASFPVPKKYVNDIISLTLGTVMDGIFEKTDLRSSTGGIGLLTHENITRIDLNYQAFTMALTSFVNADIWQDQLD